MNGNGRLPENAALESATFMTAERLSSTSSFVFRVAAFRSSAEFWRRRRPVAASKSMAAAGLNLKWVVVVIVGAEGSARDGRGCRLVGHSLAPGLGIAPRKVNAALPMAVHEQLTASTRFAVAEVARGRGGRTIARTAACFA